MQINRSALYNPEFSRPLVDNSNVDERSPSFEPAKPSEKKLTPIGRSPTEVEGSQVILSSKGQGGVDSHWASKSPR